jgi:hypothetical protein
MYVVDWWCVIWWWILCVTLQISDWQVWGVCVMIILQIHKNKKEPNNENLVKPITSFFYSSHSMIPIEHHSYNVDRSGWRNLILHEMFFFNDVLHHWWFSFVIVFFCDIFKWFLKYIYIYCKPTMAFHFKYKNIFHWKMVNLLFLLFFMSAWNENVHLALGVIVFYDLKMKEMFFLLNRFWKFENYWIKNLFGKDHAWNWLF